MVESISSGNVQFPQRGEQIDDTSGRSSADAVKRSGEQRSVDPEKPQATSDRVELSDAALRLAELAQDTNGATPESGTIAAARLAEVAQRLHDGSYDTDAVREEIARRILPDLRSHPTE